MLHTTYMIVYKGGCIRGGCMQPTLTFNTFLIGFIISSVKSIPVCVAYHLYTYNEHYLVNLLFSLHY